MVLSLKMLHPFKRLWYLALKSQDYYLGVWSCKMMKWRGYSSSPIHPKHLFDEQRSEYVHGLFDPNICFLDIGSGAGTECLMAASIGAKVSVGLEGNPQCIATAVRRARDEELNATFIQLDLEIGKLPFNDNCVDLINFSNVLEHLENRNNILAEVKRIKKEDGIAVISVPNSQTSWKKKLEVAGLDPMDDPDHKVEYSKDSLEQELSAAGLKIKSELMPIIPSWPWNGVIAMSAALSPTLYKRLQASKRQFVLNHPEESIGWVFTVQ